MRRLLFQTPLTPKIHRPMHAEVMASRRYGAGSKHLVQYIADKYGLHVKDVRAVLADVFKYIICEVMLGSGSFTIRGFGRLHRTIRVNGFAHAEQDEYNAMTFSGKESGVSFHKQVDPEWDAEIIEAGKEERQHVGDYVKVEVTDEEIEEAQERIDAAREARESGVPLIISYE